MLDESEFNRWVSMSRYTLRSASGDLERGDYSWACFKAQQAAEFAVKGLLYGIGQSAYGHSISRLLNALSELNLSVPDQVMMCAKMLDKYYIPTRYPNAWPEGAPYEYFTRQEAEQAISCAEVIISWVEKTWKLLRGERENRKE